MEKEIVTTGKTIEKAIEAALEQLHRDRDSVSVEVIHTARSGFLGIGATPAEVRVTYEVPDAEPVKEEKEEIPAAPRTALSSASRSRHPKKHPVVTSDIISRPGKPIEEKPEKAEAPRREHKNEGRQDNRKPRREQRQEPRPAAEQNVQKPQPRPQKPQHHEEAPQEPRVYAPAEAGSVEEQIEIFLKGLLEHMGSDAVPHAMKVDEDTYRAELVGGDTGMLIGRRGDTLDAIQYLTGYAVNRNREHRLRINVDAGDYRRKREASLQQLANKMAAKVVKYHRNYTLEPMNAYERHVIHAALQDYPEVTTFSTGTEPHRRIVIAYSKEKQ